MSKMEPAIPFKDFSLTLPWSRFNMLAWGAVATENQLPCPLAALRRVPARPGALMMIYRQLCSKKLSKAKHEPLKIPLQRVALRLNSLYPKAIGSDNWGWLCFNSNLMSPLRPGRAQFFEALQHFLVLETSNTATFSCTLSCNIVALQVEIVCCAANFYVAESRRRFYFLQHENWLFAEVVLPAQQTILTCNAALFRNKLNENVTCITWPLQYLALDAI